MFECFCLQEKNSEIVCKQKDFRKFEVFFADETKKNAFHVKQVFDLKNKIDFLGAK